MKTEWWKADFSPEAVMIDEFSIGQKQEQIEQNTRTNKWLQWLSKNWGEDLLKDPHLMHSSVANVLQQDISQPRIAEVSTEKDSRGQQSS
jgi:uncharacterized protein (DUF2267 family)